MDLLHVEKDKIVDRHSQPVSLRGFAVGGWMNMENFMNGFPGVEHQLRVVMEQELGAERAATFFERYLDYFFTEEDVAFIRSLGATVIRLALNYRHFETDEHPFEYLAAGFARLDQALEWCRKHGLYVIPELHSVQGWQNVDWHSDNASRHSLFWRDRLYQDRFVALWQEFARRYKDDPVIAGFDLINEPLTNACFGRFRENIELSLDHHYRPDWARMNAIYRRTAEAIHAIDPNRIVFMEGDYHSVLFRGFEAPFAGNLAYSCHNYNPGHAENWDIDRYRQYYNEQEGTCFAREYQVPLYSGEFGANTSGDPATVASYARSIDKQARVMNEMGIHWTIWNYKDIGVMGSVYLRPDAPYRQAIHPVLKAKQALEVDLFARMDSPAPVKKLIGQVARTIEAEIQDATIEPDVNQGYLEQQILSGYASQLMQVKFARCFAEMSDEAIDQTLQSLLLRNCCTSEPFINSLKARFRE